MTPTWVFRRRNPTHENGDGRFSFLGADLTIRTRWEYLFLSAYWTGETMASWHLSLPSGERFDNWPDIDQFIQRLGDDGWEMVSTTSITYPTKGLIEYSMAFKRPKSTESNGFKYSSQY